MSSPVYYLDVVKALTEYEDENVRIVLYTLKGTWKKDLSYPDSMELEGFVLVNHDTAHTFDILSTSDSLDSARHNGEQPLQDIIREYERRQKYKKELKMEILREAEEEGIIEILK